VNSSLAAGAFGWRPEVDLASDLKEALRFFGALGDPRRKSSKKARTLERQFYGLLG